MILHEIGRHKAQGPKANAKEHTPNGQAHPFVGKDAAPKTDIAAQGPDEKANIGGIVPPMPLGKGLAPRIVFCPLGSKHKGRVIFFGTAKISQITPRSPEAKIGSRQGADKFLCSI